MEEGFQAVKSKEKVEGISKSEKPKLSLTKPFAGVIVGLLLCGVSFYSGIQYQKGQSVATTNASSMGQFGGMGNANTASDGRGQRGAIGTVTAISATSVTVRDTMQNSSKTYAIDSTTQITENNASVSTSDIASGDRVMISADTNDANKAAIINVNPTMPSGGMNRSKN